MKNKTSEKLLKSPQFLEKTLADQAYKLVREDLLAGSLEPSARLRVNELKLRYGLGLSPLREALLRLASEGFVVAEGQRGFAVAPLSMAELTDITRTRQQIESIALGWAIEHGDADWEAAIIAAFHRLSRTPMPTSPTESEALLSWELKHRAFHDSLIAACESPWLLSFHTQLVHHSERYRRKRLFNAVPIDHSERERDTEHRAIMESVIARDTNKACELMRVHLQRTADAAAHALQPERKTRSKNINT